MAFPSHTYVHDGNASDVTTHTWSLPSGASSGKLLVVIAVIDGNPTVDFSTDGLTLFASGTVSSFIIRGYYKFLTGSESFTETFTTSVAEKSSVHSLLFTGAHGSIPPEAAFFDDSGSSWDAPSLNPSGWGTEQTRWYTMVATSDATNQSAFVTTPSGWTALDAYDTGGTSSDVQVNLYYKDNEAASEDPPSANLDSPAIYIAMTMGVPPAEALSNVNTYCSPRRRQRNTLLRM